MLPETANSLLVAKMMLWRDTVNYSLVGSLLVEEVWWLGSMTVVIKSSRDVAEFGGGAKSLHRHLRETIAASTSRARTHYILQDSQ
jgi:hypothetical protein